MRGRKMKNKQNFEHEYATLLEQHARLYSEFKDIQYSLNAAIAFIERQSGAEHLGNMHFERQDSSAFWIGVSGKAREHKKPWSKMD